MTTPRIQTTSSTGAPRCIALLQEHRGHGVSTAAYYLGRVLVSEGLRVLVVDLTGRRSRVQALLAHRSMKNLALWAPPLSWASNLGALLDQAREQTAGRVDVLLLDADASLLEHAGGLAAGIDYAVVVTAATLDGQDAADQIAERLGDAMPPYGRVGVVFSRVSATEADELKEQTENRKLPVIGHYPADYLLAAGDEYSVTGAEPSWPHEKYLSSIMRLARMLMRRVPLRRLSPPKAESATMESAPTSQDAPASTTAGRPESPPQGTMVDARVASMGPRAEEPQIGL